MIYKPIDYRIWNLDGSGQNIKDMLDPTESQIWASALPFQDKRDDLGHAETVTYFALKLLEQTSARRDIVIPAAILHDTGWSQLSKEELDQFYLPNWKDYEPQLRRRHQEEGVKMALRILSEVGYDSRCIPAIRDIISEHDTRKGFTSPEDGMMRDADKLWRYTSTCWQIALEKRGHTVETARQELLDWIEQKGFFYSDAAKVVAHVELDNIADFSGRTRSD